MIAFMVAGTESGVGKTTVALTLMAMLRQRGYPCSRSSAGRIFWMRATIVRSAGGLSRNLDTWMLDGEANRMSLRNRVP